MQAMKITPIIVLLISFLFLSFLTIQKRHFGKYKNLKRYYGDEFVFKEDMTFTYKCNAWKNDSTEFVDSSAGTFYLLKDTIILTYLWNLYHPHMSDSPKDSLVSRIIEPHGYFGNRPQKLYWQSRKIYYIEEATGTILRSKDNHLSHIK
jgi:hypothetical protein